MLPFFISEEASLRQSGMTYRTGPEPRPAGVGPAGFWGSGGPTLTKCANGWSTLQFDNNNCGSCGVICDASHTCCEGNCVFLVQNCGGCGPQFKCPPSHICCSTDGVFSCTQTLDDPNNCGICSNICDFSPSPVYDQIVQCCSQGKCLFTDDFKTDPQHCGNCSTDCSVTCGPDCICSGGHCCPPCNVWFDGSSGPNWGLYGAIAGGIIEGALGALTLGLIGKLISKKLKPGCYSCSKINHESGSDLACCDLQNCTDLKTNNEHCGNCENNCGTWDCEQDASGGFCSPSNRICQNGRCRCPADLPWLCEDGQCVDLTTDPSNCGTCGGVCFPGETCCDSVCADFQTSVHNCGVCGRDCSAKNLGFGEGACCNGTCIDVSHDAHNCGGCGLTCAKPSFCSDGLCNPPIQ